MRNTSNQSKCICRSSQFVRFFYMCHQCLIQVMPDRVSGNFKIIFPNCAYFCNCKCIQCSCFSFQSFIIDESLKYFFIEFTNWTSRVQHAWMEDHISSIIVDVSVATRKQIFSSRIGDRTKMRTEWKSLNINVRIVVLFYCISFMKYVCCLPSKRRYLTEIKNGLCFQ